MIYRRELMPVDTGVVLLRHLSRGSLYVPLACCGFLCGGRPCIDAAGAAIITDAVNRYIVDYRPVNISVMDDRRIHIGDRRIVTEPPANPTTAGIAVTIIPASIVHTAIEADMRPPITCVPAINSVDVTPITRRPQKANFRWLSPVTRHPKISIIIIIGPVSGDPEIAIDRTGWLRIHWNDRRPNMNADADA